MLSRDDDDDDTSHDKMEMKTDKDSEKKPSNSTDNCVLQWSQWQLLDSILPTGGFAHSLGLESSIQSHLISTPQDLQTFTIHLLHNTGSLLLPYVYTAATSPDAVTLRSLDKALDATLTNEVARKASVSQGAALMRVAAAVFTETVPSIKAMRDSCLGSCNFHHAPVFGLVCGLLGMDSATAQRGYMFITMRDVISAATRLNLVGPLGAAVMQHRIAPFAEEIVIKWMDRSVEDACQIIEVIMPVQMSEYCRRSSFGVWRVGNIHLAILSNGLRVVLCCVFLLVGLLRRSAQLLFHRTDCV